MSTISIWMSLPAAFNPASMAWISLTSSGLVVSKSLLTSLSVTGSASDGTTNASDSDSAVAPSIRVLRSLGSPPVMLVGIGSRVLHPRSGGRRRRSRRKGELATDAEAGAGGGGRGRKQKKRKKKKKKQRTRT